MTKPHLYQRLVDPEVCPAKSAPSLIRTANAVLVVAVIAVLLTVVVIGSLLTFVFLLPAWPCTSSSADARPCSSPGSDATSSVDVDRLLERLDSLEREVAALKSECRRWSSSGSGHGGQPSDKGSLEQETSLVTLQQEDVQGKTSPEDSPKWTVIPSRPTIPTGQPLANDPASNLAHDFELGLSPPEQHRNPRSKDGKKARRQPQEGDTDDSALPEEERGNGGRGNGKKKGDKGCKHCICKETTLVEQDRVSILGKAAHIQGTREGNIEIANEWIRGPRTWEMSPYSNSEFFSLNVLGTVTVHEDGLYYVYSQVLFYDSNNTVGQSICIDDYERFTCVKSNISAEAKQSTCYIGGVVSLSRGSQVAIKLSIPSVTVALYADTTYFGLFKVA